jgi:hypothetical protein
MVFPLVVVGNPFVIIIVDGVARIHGVIRSRKNTTGIVRIDVPLDMVRNVSNKLIDKATDTSWLILACVVIIVCTAQVC